MQSANASKTKYGQRTYQHTEEIVEALEEYARWHQATVELKGEVCLASYLAEYFRRLDNKQEKKYYNAYDMGPHRGVLLLRAAMLFEESSEEWVQSFRLRYTEACNGIESMPAVLLGCPHVTSAITRYEFIRVMKEAMPEREVDYSLLNGAWAAVQIYIQRFIETIYIGAGMHERIATAEVRGIGGVFGSTKLLTYGITGRTMFTFSREDKSMITFVSESEDNLALGMGVQSCCTDPITAMSMIEDVITNYDPALFQEDMSIKMI